MKSTLTARLSSILLWRVPLTLFTVVLPERTQTLSTTRHKQHDSAEAQQTRPTRWEHCEVIHETLFFLS